MQVGRFAIPMSTALSVTHMDLNKEGVGDNKMNERLLGEQEVLEACSTRAKDVLWKSMTAEEKFKASSGAVTIAQDSKTTAALIAWVDKAKMNCSTGECKFYVGCLTEFAGHYCKAWQELKESIKDG